MLTLQEKKAYGSFYTPRILADLLASTLISFSKSESGKTYTVVDPATGDSSLLSSFYNYANNKDLKFRYFGIDIDENAIKKSRDIFADKNVDSVFLKTDALYPYPSLSTDVGWNKLVKEFIPNGIDFIVSNPPWGADKNKYRNLSTDFKTAQGQFDIYDIFIEIAINNLKEDGAYGIIVPDTIYEEEHLSVRKFLLENTTLRRIIRIGEGFFNNVNIATTLLFGEKNIQPITILYAHIFQKRPKRKFYLEKPNYPKLLENFLLKFLSK